MQPGFSTLWESRGVSLWMAAWSTTFRQSSLAPLKLLQEPRFRRDFPPQGKVRHRLFPSLPWAVIMTAGTTSATVMPLSLLNSCNRTNADKKGPRIHNNRSPASIVYGLARLFMERLIFSRCDANRPNKTQRSLCLCLCVYVCVFKRIVMSWTSVCE